MDDGARAHRHGPWTTLAASPTARAFAHIPTAFDQGRRTPKTGPQYTGLVYNGSTLGPSRGQVSPGSIPRLEKTATKRCSRCLASKLRADFTRDWSAADGLAEPCRRCQTEARHVAGFRKKLLTQTFYPATRESPSESKSSSATTRPRSTRSPPRLAGRIGAASKAVQHEAASHDLRRLRPRSPYGDRTVVGMLADDGLMIALCRPCGALAQGSDLYASQINAAAHSGTSRAHLETVFKKAGFDLPTNEAEMRAVFSAMARGYESDTGLKAPTFETIMAAVNRGAAQ